MYSGGTESGRPWQTQGQTDARFPQTNAGRPRYGVVGGLNASAVSDLLSRLVEAVEALPSTVQPEFVIDRQPYADECAVAEMAFDPTRKELYLYDVVRGFAAAGVEAVILPCFLCHAFIEELQGEVRLPVFNLFEAVRTHLAANFPNARRIGVVTSDFVRAQRLFERSLPADSGRLVYPDDDVQRDCVMPAIQGRDNAGDLLAKACENLMEQGVDVIVPAAIEMAGRVSALQAQGWPVIDVHRAYAEYIVSTRPTPLKKPFKIGVVGGVGPAATVDLMSKIVVNTPARKDQEHIKVVVEENPQIPDRTDNLLNGGRDPTIALYATCKRLEEDEASVIAIPCNTAHAYIARIQSLLSIPIVNMLHETMAYIADHYPAQKKKIGLLATTGTIRTRVYHQAAQVVGCELIVPDAEHQQQVMAAIYGPQGVKAGHTEGECVTQLQSAMASLVARGAEILVLGCTELPLIMQQNAAYPIAGKTVVVIDPTEILARKCVSLALADAAR